MFAYWLERVTPSVSIYTTGERAPMVYAMMAMAYDR